MRTQFTEASGVPIAYQVIGDGDIDIVLVPGMASHLELHWCEPGFARLMRQMASLGRLITFDKRGTGRSLRVRGVPTLEDRMADLVAVLDAAGSERAVVFGISEGAALAALFAATYPARARGLILCSSFPTGFRDGDYLGAVRPERMEHAMDVWASWGDGRSYDLYAPSLVGNRLHRYFLGVFERAAASRAMVQSLVDALFAIDIRPILPLVQVPTLMFHRIGEIAPIESARQMARLIPDCQLVELEGADHVPFGPDGGDIISERTARFISDLRAERYDRAVATVMFTDIVDSTSTAARLGDRAWLALLDRHDDVVRTCVERHRGRELKNLGDGFLIHFDGPVRAIRCATAIHDAMAPLPLSVRVGIHTGDLQLTEREVRGLAVHVAARVSASAGAGETVVSRAVRDLTTGSGIEFEARRPTELKGLDGRWRLYRVDPASVTTPSDPAFDVHRERGDLVDRALVSFSRRFPGLTAVVLAANRRPPLHRRRPTAPPREPAPGAQQGEPVASPE